MEKKNNKKIFIIIGVIILAIVVIIICKKFNKSEDNVNVSKNEVVNNESVKIQSVDFSNLEQAITSNDIITATTEYKKVKDLNKNEEDITKFGIITNNFEELKDKKKEDLLQKIDSTYDDMTQNTTYTLKGNDNTFTEDVNLIPILVYDSKNKMPVFGLQLGFVNESWIFFESLIINVDGDLTNISSNYYDKTKEVITGGVFERCILYTEKYPTLNTLVGKMINGTETKVRFVGQAGKGNIDHIVTSSEIEYLKVLYELSLCL